MRILTYLILLISFSLINKFSLKKDQNVHFELEIIITNIENPGNIFIAVYNNALDFNSDDDSSVRITYPIKESVIKDSFTKKITLKPGTYAFKVYVDKNYNNKFDFNFFGLPKEQYGFSNDVMGLFGPPNFQEASFKLNSNRTIKTKMK